MSSRNEHTKRGELAPGQDLLEAIATIVAAQREVRLLQAKRDLAATKLRELLGIEENDSVWPTCPDDIPAVLRPQAEATSLEYILAREATARAVRKHGYPGHLASKYVGLSVLIATRDGMKEDVIKVPAPNQTSGINTTRSREGRIELAGVTAESPQIGDGILWIRPEGTNTNIFAEVSVIGPDMTPYVDITVRDL